MKMPAIVAATLLAVTSAEARVVTATPDALEVTDTVHVSAPPARVWALLGTPARWWDPAHSYSQDAANLTLDLRAAGCFCERVPGGGSVEHGRVVLVLPRRMLRLSAALGPLQAGAVAGTWTITLTPGGDGADVEFHYTAAGYLSGGLQPVAPAVERVMAGQLRRLAAVAEGRAPR